MEEKGWRGLIYDAPWAYFASGQNGVTTSDDRKECETLNDDITSIKIDFDPNVTFETREGHILFRQKGSDLFDIVCITQEPGGEYRLDAVGDEIGGCEGNFYDKWDAFINAISLYVTTNDTRREITDPAEKEAAIKRPTKSEARDTYNSFVNTGNTDIPIYVTAVTSYNTAGTITSTATTTVALKGREQTSEESTNESRWNLDAVELTVEQQGTVACRLKARNGSTSVDCNGGEVQFDVVTVQSTCLITIFEEPTENCKTTIRCVASESQITKNYTITGLTQASVEHKYIVREGCGAAPRDVWKTGRIIQWTILYPSSDLINITNTSDDVITFTVDPSVNYLMLKATSDKGTTTEKTFNFNNLGV